MAVSTQAVYHNLVAAYREARFGRSVHVGQAAVQLENTSAGVASEMVMVAFEALFEYTLRLNNSIRTPLETRFDPR